MTSTGQSMLDEQQSTLAGPLPEITLGVQETSRRSNPQPPGEAESRLRMCARLYARSWKQSGAHASPRTLARKWKRAGRSIRQACLELQKRRSLHIDLPEGARALLENATLVRMTLRETHAALRTALELPLVDIASEGNVPRAYYAMDNYLSMVRYQISDRTLSAFLNAFQETVPLQYAEIWMLQSFAQVALLERIGEIAEEYATREHLAPQPEMQKDSELQRLLFCLQQTLSLDWKTLFDEISVVDRVLRRDPQGAYSRMDLESRHFYCKTVAELARRSRCSEQEVARRAVDLARDPTTARSQRAVDRQAHVGYYLIDKGRTHLQLVIYYRSSAVTKVRDAVHRRPTLVYFSAIALGTVAVLFSFLAALGLSHARLLEIGLVLLPAVESAVAATNLLVAALIPPQRLPRLDFSKGIPLENATLVVIPALVTSEEQVRKAAKDLEIRYLANSDPNLHFALVTDLPDSVTPCDDKDVLAGLCSGLITELNDRYAAQKRGSFFHLHRRRVYNPSEGIWMGWERKRGKLLDLNNLLLNEADSFPVKVGNLPILRSIRYVITLDLDTQLPRSSAHKLVGALAHPLNRAVIDPETNTVVDGYGILQPRVEISISSAARSRLAALFSIDTGFDLYTRAVSDVYQDLFGEGIFTGKGIYEVETFQRVLEQRFPSNAVLSHDLIEGVHARTGLLSDIEVIDDYPSHVSAYTRRRHRWVRGDWQIIFWLFPTVPDYRKRLVANPLSLISRWKIADNLRRSLTDFVSFLLLVGGWLFAPADAMRWTLAALTLIALPGYLQLVVCFVRGGRMAHTLPFWKNGGADVSRFYTQFFLRLALLCYQSLVSVDAIIRTLVRLAITHKRLLQWETAAQSEVARNRGKDTLESYLTWMPLIASALAVLILLLQPSSLWSAMPLLALWALSPRVSDWLNRPVRLSRFAAPSADRDFLRRAALRTWRFFAEFSGEDENWLIPDVVHEARDVIAHRVSTTNLGLLLNARLAAWDLGFLTLQELVETTWKTLETVRRMPTYKGNLYNWYDTHTLEPLSPRFVSAVDNGNFVCCLWTLRQGFLEARRSPLFPNNLWQGLQDHLAMLQEFLEAPECGRLLAAVQNLMRAAEAIAKSPCPSPAAVTALLKQASSLREECSTFALIGEGQWWAGALFDRLDKIHALVESFAPWLLPRFAASPFLLLLDPIALQDITLENSLQVYSSLKKKLQRITRHKTKSLFVPDPEPESLLLLTECAECACQALVEKLAALEAIASDIAAAQDFAALYDQECKLLSIGYDAENERLHSCHYDLLASEARAAAFVAVAKGDIPQESWFRFKRSFQSFRCKNALLSWSGTMFEYLLPFLWMKPHPDTVLDRSARTAVKVQQDFARRKSIPWGISESSCSERNPDGHFRYQAFGIQELAFDHLNAEDLVVSPYATFLSLAVEEKAAIANLRAMKAMGLIGAFGFYEACDFTKTRIGSETQYLTVPCWMAHHQGMSLLAATNALCGAPMQRRFHAEPLVAATERLLHEKFPRFLSALKMEGDETSRRVPDSLSPVELLRTPELWIPVADTALPPNS